MAIRFEQVLNWHELSYPGMAIDDWYKLLHQGVYGIGHLLSFQEGPKLVEALRRESAGLERVRFHENLIDPLDEDWRLVRLNLRLYARVARDVSDLVPAMVETARTVKGELRLMSERVKLTAHWLKKRVPFLSNAMLRFGVRMALDDYPTVHHSDWFERHYHPAYRVVLKNLILATLPDDEARQAFETRVALDQRLFAFRELGYDVDEHRRRVISAARPLPQRMLEVGTGNGGLTLLLAEQPVRLVSVDTDAAAQARVRLGLRFQAQKGQVEFLTADAQHLPFRDREFALVFSTNTFHHLRQADAVLAEMARVCRNRLVIADFNEHGLELIRKLHQGEGREHEEVGGDFGRVPGLLARLGFQVEQREWTFETTYVARRARGSPAPNPEIDLPQRHHAHHGKTNRGDSRKRIPGFEDSGIQGKTLDSLIPGFPDSCLDSGFLDSQVPASLCSSCRRVSIPVLGPVCPPGRSLHRGQGSDGLKRGVDKR